MPTNTNTTTIINSGTGTTATKPAAFYDKTLLKTLRLRMFHHDKYAQKRPMPKNSGDTINFRKIGTLAVALTPLTEGVTPDGEVASITAISATTKQYGSPIYFTDVVNFQQIDPIIAEYTVEQGHQAGETLDVLTRDELAGGTNVFYAASRVSRITLAAGDKPTIAGIRKMRLQMKKNKVKQINGKYVMFITPDMTEDLLDDPQFLKAYEIGQNNTAFVNGEIADVYGIKFIEVINAKTFPGAGALGVNVHAGIMLGDQAYGITNITGEGDVKSIVKALGSAGTADALDQVQSIAWKVNAFVAKRLTEEAINRYECVPTTAG